jgi:hypothetical protein
MMSVILMLSVICAECYYKHFMLSVIMLNAIMLNVVAPHLMQLL